ncbi:hypothetical protein [Brevundimonas sp. Leaf168]|uniref:hypothetical protein n=1 Tax=Brevundimonas sp. Leaf168 TaxID=1736283 RepID=UPI0006F2511A|nr:hypothetical protein [Brevundimonas sp. Leaf168]
MNRQRQTDGLNIDLDDQTTLVITFLSLIDGGFSEGQAALAETAARQCGMPFRHALSILQRYTGSDDRDHYWRLREGSRSQHSYELLPPCRNMAGA